MKIFGCDLPFAVLLAVFAAVCFFAAFVFLVSAASPAKLKKMEAFPRSRVCGTILGALVVFGCVPHIEELLSPDSFFLRGHLLWILAAVLLILAIVYADFLCARALSAALIFFAYLLLREGFAENPPFYPIAAGVFFLLGSAGIVLAAKPCWLRDWIRAAFMKSPVRWISGLLFLIPALGAAAELVLIYTAKK